jgi:lycopene cyclase domain-containing protein
MSLYLLVILGSIAGPFFLIFDKKVHFYTYWKYMFPAILSVAFIFLVWDEYFTQNNIWGFNPAYLQGIYIGNLPLEECLFFLVVPYACIFIYEVLKAYFPHFKPVKFAHFFAFGFTLAGFVFGLSYMDNWYTASACLSASILTVGIYFIKRVAWYSQFVNAFLVSTVPFLLVNGVLTGGFTPDPIVWYSEEHIIGIRIFTIPLEDVFYNYCMLFPMIAIFEWLKNRKVINNKQTSK